MTGDPGRSDSASHLVYAEWSAGTVFTTFFLRHDHDVFSKLTVFILCDFGRRHDPMRGNHRSFWVLRSSTLFWLTTTLDDDNLKVDLFRDLLYVTFPYSFGATSSEKYWWQLSNPQSLPRLSAHDVEEIPEFFFFPTTCSDLSPTVLSLTTRDQTHTNAMQK